MNIPQEQREILQSIANYTKQALDNEMSTEQELLKGRLALSELLSLSRLTAPIYANGQTQDAFYLTLMLIEAQKEIEDLKKQLEHK